MQQQQHQEQLYQILQKQQIPNQKRGMHQRNKSFSSFLSIKYKNQSNSANNTISERSDRKKYNSIIENSIQGHSNKSYSNSNENENSFSDYSESIKEVERRCDDFFPKRSKRRSHNKSLSENINKSNKYNYDSIANNGNFEGSLYNKISSAINRKFSSNKRVASQKSSYKSTKKSDADTNKKKSINGIINITNFDILKKQLENISNKRKTDDSLERLKKTGFFSKEANNSQNNNVKSINTSSCSKIVTLDNQILNNDNNKNYYNSLNESINNSINFNYNNNSSNSYNDLSVTSINKLELNNDSYSNNGGDNENSSNSDSEINKPNKPMKNNGIKDNSTVNDKENVTKKDDDSIIVKPLCQINTDNDTKDNQVSQNNNNNNTSNSHSEESRRKSSNESHLINKVLKYRNKYSKNDKENIISLFNNGLTVSPSISNNIYALSDEDNNSSNVLLSSSNEKNI